MKNETKNKKTSLACLVFKVPILEYSFSSILCSLWYLRWRRIYWWIDRQLQSRLFSCKYLKTSFQTNLYILKTKQITEPLNPLFGAQEIENTIRHLCLASPIKPKPYQQRNFTLKMFKIVHEWHTCIQYISPVPPYMHIIMYSWYTWLLLSWVSHILFYITPLLSLEIFYIMPS